MVQLMMTIQTIKNYCTPQKPRALIWKFFSTESQDSCRTVICSICKWKLFMVDQRVIWKHIWRIDKLTWSFLPQVVWRKRVWKSKQYSNWFQNPMKQAKKIENGSIMLYITTDLLPFTCLENTGITTILKILALDYTPPSQTHLRDKLIPELYPKVKEVSYCFKYLFNWIKGDCLNSVASFCCSYNWVILL